jgi:hypothetical protein
MGCDIHFHMEALKKGKWAEIPGPLRPCFSCADKPEPDPKCYWCKGKGTRHEEWYDGRNYHLFAILASVRNGYGFAGIKTGEGFIPIAPPRGLPEDVSRRVAAESDKWGCDGHSHSWHNLQHLLDYNWDQTSTLQGVISIAEYFHWRQACADAGKALCPGTYSGGIMGKDIATVTAASADKLLLDKVVKITWNEAESRFRDESSDGVRYFVLVRWEETYREAIGEHFFRDAVEPMKEFASQYGGNDKVRIVFWFDN